MVYRMCVTGTVNIYLFTLLNICTTARTHYNAHSEGTYMSYILHETLYIMYNVQIVHCTMVPLLKIKNVT